MTQDRLFLSIPKAKGVAGKAILVMNIPRKLEEAIGKYDQKNTNSNYVSATMIRISGFFIKSVVGHGR